jgi:hypothetical protein
MVSRFLTSVAVAAYAVTLPGVLGGPTFLYDVLPRTPAAGIDLKTLAPSLSPNTEIYLPGDTEFTIYTVRWSNLGAPTPNVVIAPSTEKDVAKIVSCLATTCSGHNVG